MKARREPLPAAGFTLIELLIAAAIGMLVMAAVMAALAGGLRVWERMRGGSSDLFDTALAVEWLQRDLHNVSRSRMAAFDGRDDALRMPVRVAAPWQGPSAVSLEAVAYAVRADTRSLERRRTPLPEGSAPAAVDTVLAGVESVRFAYQARNSGAWQPAWSSATNVPRAVRVVIRMGADRDHFEIQRTIVIPGA